MTTLIVKLGAAGDVIRTTTLLHLFSGEVDWLVSDSNLPLLAFDRPGLRAVPWSARKDLAGRNYDLIVNLEESKEICKFVSTFETLETYGTRFSKRGHVTYSESSRDWYDMSRISRLGLEQADELKRANRRSFQEIHFKGLGFPFKGERYLLPKPKRSDLSGDVALVANVGESWPMKAWAHYDELRSALSNQGLRVNLLPLRACVLEHLADVASHAFLFSADSLPMHLALGLGIPCVTFFNCTSPWEIFGYGRQAQVISPDLGRFYYQTGFDPVATRAISVEIALDAFLSLRAPKRFKPAAGREATP